MNIWVRCTLFLSTELSPEMTKAVHNVTAILLPFPTDDRLTLDVTDNLDPADMPVSHLAAWPNKIHQMHDTDLGYMIIPHSELANVDVRNDASPEQKSVNSVKDNSEPKVASSNSKTVASSGSHHYVCKDAIVDAKSTDDTEIKTDSAKKEDVKRVKDKLDKSEPKVAHSKSKTDVSSDSHHYVCKDASDDKTTTEDVEIQKDLTKVDHTDINHSIDQNDKNEGMEYYVTCLLYDLESQNALVELDPTPTHTIDIPDINTHDQQVDELDEKTTEISDAPSNSDDQALANLDEEMPNPPANTMQISDAPADTNTSDQQFVGLDAMSTDSNPGSDKPDLALAKLDDGLSDSTPTTMVISDIHADNNSSDQIADELDKTISDTPAESDDSDQALAKLDDEIPNPAKTKQFSDITADTDQQVDDLHETSTEISNSDEMPDFLEENDTSEQEFEEATSEPVTEDPDTSFQTESSYYSTVSQDQKKVIDPETVQRDNQTDPNSSESQTMDIPVNDEECQVPESGLKSTQTDTIDTSIKSSQVTTLEHNESQTDTIDISTKSFQAITSENNESQTDAIENSDEGPQEEVGNQSNEKVQTEQSDKNKQKILSEHQGSQTDKVENSEEGVQVSGPAVKSEEVQVEGLDSSLEEYSENKDTDSLYANTECSESQTDISGPITLLSDGATSDTIDNRYGNEMEDGLPVEIGGSLVNNGLDNRFAVDSGKTLETHTVTVTAQCFRIKQENLSPAHRDQIHSEDIATVGKQEEPDTPVFEDDIIPNTNLRRRNVPNILQSLGSAVGSVSSDEEGGVFPPILDLPGSSAGQPTGEANQEGEAGAAENEPGEAGGSGGFLPDLLAHPDDSFSGESQSDILSSGIGGESENVESSGIVGESTNVKSSIESSGYDGTSGLNEGSKTGDEPDTILSAASAGLSGETESAESASFVISGKAKTSSTETLDDVRATQGLAIAERTIEHEVKNSEPIIIVSHHKQDALDWCCRFFVPLYVLCLLFLVLLCLLSLQRSDNRCCFQNAFKHSFQLMLRYSNGSPPI